MTPPELGIFPVRLDQKALFLSKASVSALQYKVLFEVTPLLGHYIRTCTTVSALILRKFLFSNLLCCAIPRVSPQVSQGSWDLSDGGVPISVAV